MKKFLSLSMATMLAGTMILLSFSDADARHKRWHVGAVVGGVIGGIALGATIANSNRRARNRHCHRGYCHTHSYRYSNHRHRPVVYDPPPRRRAPIRRSYGSDAHEEWCFDRYRSYRAYDNTFQPYRGGRRYCRSPYG